MGSHPLQGGVPQIEVTFDIDADGILHVTAKDKATNKEQSIRITASSGLSKEEVDRLVKEAEEHRAEDRRRRELVDARNRADSLIYQTEKHLKEFGDKISQEDRNRIEEKIKSLKEVMKGEDKSAIDKGIEELQKATYKLSEELYKRAASEKPSASKEEKKEEGKVDTDYQVYDEEDKRN